MVYDKSKPLTKRNLVAFLKDLGIEVKTNTKARGNQGLYQKNRIDISRGLKEEDAISTLVHEFAHHIHFQIDKDFIKNGGTSETLFATTLCMDWQVEMGGYSSKPMNPVNQNG